jgi:hypothetical protein
VSLLVSQDYPNIDQSTKASFLALLVVTIQLWTNEIVTGEFYVSRRPEACPDLISSKAALSCFAWDDPP